MRRLRRARAVSPAILGICLSFLLAAATPLVAQAQASPSPAPVITPTPTALTVVATYPAVVVDPGGEARFPLEISGPATERVDLTVQGAPEGFDASFRGGAATVSSVQSGLPEPAPLELRVKVPQDATPGTRSITMVATAPSGAVQTPLDVVVADTSGGAVTLSTDFPALRGSSEDTYSFSLTLKNDTAQDIDFVLAGQGPDGWDVTVQPSGQEKAATTLVAAGESQSLRVTVTPAPRSDPGQYPITVTASGGGFDAQQPLGVEITGSYSMTLDSVDGRLNTSANAGSATAFDIVVSNTGTAPLEAVKLAGRAPSGWTVTMDPEVIDAVAPGETATGVANIQPVGNAVAGDYVVTLTATADQANESIQVRTTVETSTLWGVAAVGIVVLVLIGLGLVFRRYGRR